MTEKKSDVTKAIGMPSSDKYPAEDKETFDKIFTAICDTYQLDNPVDQMIANRAATHLMTLQFLQSKLRKYGLFYEIENLETGTVMVKMNEMSYYMKTVESEFRSCIRMLRQIAPIEDSKGGPKDFSDWLNTDGKEKSIRPKKNKN